MLEPVKLTVDPALKGRNRRQAAGAALYQIMSDLVFRTTSTDRTVFEAVVEAAATHGWRRVAVEDPITGSLTYKRLLLGASVLGRKLMPLAEEGEALGVMLPNANGAAATILAADVGRPRAGDDQLHGRRREHPRRLQGGRDRDHRHLARLRREGEARAARRRARPRRCGVVYLEDVRAGIGILDKLRGLASFKKPLVRREPDDPRRDPLHLGLGRRAEGRRALPPQHAGERRAGRGADRFRPHRQGLQRPAGVPLLRADGRPRAAARLRRAGSISIPRRCTTGSSRSWSTARTRRSCSAPTPSSPATRASAHPYDFRSLRYILAGAEPVKEATRRVYMEKFGLRILEGYGVTETAPVLAINTPMFNRFGTVGRLMPGMEAQLEPVPGVEEGGRLFVRGPNVMLGYLKAENPGVLEPPAEGWHDTGDIVAIDAQGFVAIKGRAKRFAKIGGEMVSLAAVEALAAELWPDALSAVASAPDARKGERLVLVTERRDASRAAFQAFAKAKGASELMIPAEVLVVDKVPVLGSGKLDYVGVATLVRERAATAEPLVAAE